jgi:hypothetical protein
MSWDDSLLELFGTDEEGSSYESSESEVAVSPKLQPRLPLPDRLEYIKKLGEDYLMSLPPEPDDRVERILYNYYYAVQYAIFHYKFDGKKPLPDLENDTDDQIREKSYYMHLTHCYNELIKAVSAFAEEYYENIKTRLAEHVGSRNDPLLIFVNCLKKHKELHSRRIKTDPGAARTKTDEVSITWNSVTHVAFNSQNPDHKSWITLIINPLPSDYDPEAEDPSMGHRKRELEREIHRLRGGFTVEEPFFIVVTPEWDKLIRVVHVLLHFEDYLNTYVVGCIDDWDDIRDMNWADSWEYLFGEYANVPLMKLSREKKKVPMVVSRMAELRDFLKDIM